MKKEPQSKKILFLTGGVCSGLGKGIAISSIGALLEEQGVKISLVKVDPYLNRDAGTMSPYQHGEVFVTEDGAETDLDLGNYSRFTSSVITAENSMTAGKIYAQVLAKERAGDFLGKTVQVIPHVTGEIISWIERIQKRDDSLVLIEVGGTVGDIESIPFIEAARQMQHQLGRENVLFIHLTYLPRPNKDEVKTKPTQHSVRLLQNLGIQPHIILCRERENIEEEVREKIALFTNVDAGAVFSFPDVRSIYEVPYLFAQQKIDQWIMDFFKLERKPLPNGKSQWEILSERIQRLGEKEFEQGSENSLRRAEASLEQNSAKIPRVRVGIVGKYARYEDSYHSIMEALYHAGFSLECAVEIERLDTQSLFSQNKEDFEKRLEALDGILIPGGFDQKGTAGMINAIRLAREKQMPFFGICLGMQLMVIEYSRNVLGLLEAQSEEFDAQASDLVISLLEEQKQKWGYGGTMRLGSQKTLLKEGTQARESYGQSVIFERHRHRYEFNPKYEKDLSEAGFIIAGKTEHGLVEICEWKQGPFAVGVQFHPEFQSQPTKPHPLFYSFLKSALDHASQKRS